MPKEWWFKMIWCSHNSLHKIDTWSLQESSSILEFCGDWNEFWTLINYEPLPLGVEFFSKFKCTYRVINKIVFDAPYIEVFLFVK